MGTREINRKERFRKIKNFALYYGRGREKELGCFDLAVVESQGQDRQSVSRMQEAGALVLAYVSVIEVPPWLAEFKMLGPEDFLQNNGKIMTNQVWGTYLADICSPRWRNLLKNRVCRLLETGYDGLFLDTIGDLEFIALPGRRRDSLVMAAVDFLRELREAYPRHLVVQNNGLGKVYRLSADLVDGVCWENPPFGSKDSAAWVQGMIARLRQLRQDKPELQVFLLLEENEAGAIEMARDVAAKNGFFLYVAPCGYTGGITGYRNN